MARNMGELSQRGEANEVITILRQSVVKVELGAEQLHIHYVPPLIKELKPKTGFKVVSPRESDHITIIDTRHKIQTSSR